MINCSQCTLILFATPGLKNALGSEGCESAVNALYFVFRFTMQGVTIDYYYLIMHGVTQGENVLKGETNGFPYLNSRTSNFN